MAVTCLPIMDGGMRWVDPDDVVGAMVRSQIGAPVGICNNARIGVPKRL